ncbi:MAG: hypothetical protein IPL16_00005 [Ignavibacteria bacterium]|nr:hypothetical protein [Ignavibacteria bacterium]
MVESNRLVIIGSGGRIMNSTDLGASWQIQNGFKKSLYSNYFTGANTGYAVGDSGKDIKDN